MLPFYTAGKALLYIKEIEQGDTVFIDMHPSNVCNHACIWCRFPHDKKSLSYTDMVWFLDRYPYLKGIRLSGGGEPLMNPDTIPFIEECVRRGIVVGLFTNGSLINESNIPTIAKCTFCRISLDAFTAQTHRITHHTQDFNKILSNINDLAYAGIKQLGISFMVTDETVEDIPLVNSTYISSLPVNYFNFKPLISGISDKTKETALAYLRTAEHNHRITINYTRIIEDTYANTGILCRITRIIKGVAADGCVYACCEHSYEPEYNVDMWDGDNSKCRNCVYNGYNEILDMYYTNSISKECL